MCIVCKQAGLQPATEESPRSRDGDSSLLFCTVSDEKLEGKPGFKATNLLTVVKQYIQLINWRV